MESSPRIRGGGERTRAHGNLRELLGLHERSDRIFLFKKGLTIITTSSTIGEGFVITIFTRRSEYFDDIKRARLVATPISNMCLVENPSASKIHIQFPEI
jgi:hypothetical protein